MVRSLRESTTLLPGASAAWQWLGEPNDGVQLIPRRKTDATTRIKSTNFSEPIIFCIVDRHATDSPIIVCLPKVMLLLPFWENLMAVHMILAGITRAAVTPQSLHHNGPSLAELWWRRHDSCHSSQPAIIQLLFWSVAILAAPATNYICRSNTWKADNIL